MIYFNDVTKIFKTDFLHRPVLALDHLSFKIPEGRLVGFLGANGAGKTTAIKILTGLTHPTKGAIQFDPKLGTTSQAIRAKIGLLPERPYFYSYLRGRELIEYIAQLHGMKVLLIKEKIAWWGERLNITHALERKIATYSKGMLQRLGMVSVLVHDPQVLVLDEPLSGLDPIGRKEFKDVMKEVHQMGKTIFFSSHILADVEEICEEVLCLHRGRLTYSGSVAQLLAQHSAPYRIMLQRPFAFSLPSYISVIKDYPHGVMITVASEFKNQLIDYIIGNKGVIESLEQEKKSLEDLFFQEWSK